MSNVKGILIFISGITVGVISSMYVLKRKYEDQLQEELESIREVYVKNSLRRAGKNIYNEEKVVNGNAPVLAKQDENDINYFSESLDDTVPIYEGDKIVDSYKQEKITNLYKKPSLAELQYPMDSEEEGTVIVHQAPPYGRTDPYLIDDVQFMEDCEHHEKITLCWHSDNILADENEEVIEDPAEAVGLDNLKEFDDCETDCIYVRNCNTGIDYEIIRVVTSYEALKLGVGD
jgi:hypothetical protein